MQNSINQIIWKIQDFLSHYCFPHRETHLIWVYYYTRDTFHIED